MADEREEVLFAALHDLAKAGVHEGEVWRHRKSGDNYRVVCLGFVEADLTLLVTYRRDGSDYAWSRPLANFLERFDHVGIGPQPDRS